MEAEGSDPLAFRRHLIAAEGYLELGMPRDALRELGAIEGDRDGDAHVLRLRLRALNGLGDWAPCEALARDVDDPAVRLELAKLYEHHVKAPDKALELLERGTGERAEDAERRRVRLERKARKQAKAGG